ncbi:DUF4331 family protein [Jejudonia soesokkakensis]|uniref:DUF4331 family protein n=1 Tax=Jejudonia soesokkakensis TaxID=1323432 RepID=A0ABW2MX69_9FLAO
MKKTKIFAAIIGGLGVAVLSFFLVAADHIDSPSVAGTTTDIADLYAFQGTNPNNTVLIATLQGPLMPGDQTNNAQFDENVMIEFNIDRTGDFVEDLVIQAVRRGDSMYFWGPTPPLQTGLSSEVAVDTPRSSVAISGSTVQTSTNSDTGISYFAGPRRDAFFFDFNRFNAIVSGSVAPEGFLPPSQASDFFENLNVLAIVVEVPNALLGEAPPHVAAAVGIDGLPNSYNVWVSAKRRQ